MRITQSMLTNNMIRNINNSYLKLGVYQNQLSTQKKISRPSDDPVVAFKGIQYRTNVAEVEQYKRNMGEVNNWLENTEDALDQTNAAISRLSELVVQANNKTLTNDERKKIETEVEEIKKQVISLANTKISGKYIFNGTDIYTQPVNYDSATGNISANFNNQYIQIEVSSGIRLDVNFLGSEIFKYDAASATDKGLLGDIEELQKQLTGNGTGSEPELGEFITKMQQHLETINSARSSIGATMNRVELISDRLDSMGLISEKMVSNNEDIDVEETILKFKTQESVHQAALSVGAKIIQNTLVDFIR